MLNYGCFLMNPTAPRNFLTSLVSSSPSSASSPFKKSASLALGLLLSSAPLTIISLNIFTSPVLAGGSGGSFIARGGKGGSAGNNGAAGISSNGTLYAAGGGGGGGNILISPYNTAGSGGSSINGVGGSGGIGNGSNGSSGITNVFGSGGGGGNTTVFSGNIINPTTGGDGGDGGGTNYGGGGGGGGDGDGVIVTSDSTISSTIKGGAGGRGGNAGGGGGGGDDANGGNASNGNNPVSGGGGGGGGSGIIAFGHTTIINSHIISGGVGGVGGAGVRAGDPGAGGVGILGASSGTTSIINSGTITGEMNGNNTLRANAITFSGNNNRLEIQSGSTITGNVTNGGGTTGNTFALGGTINSTFAVSQIGAAVQYRGFNLFEKTGTSLWELTSTTTAVMPWTIKEGTLAISSDTNLGAASGTLTLGNSVANTSGTLKFNANATIARPLVLAGTGGGIIDVNNTQSEIGDTGTPTAIISGDGPLTVIDSSNSGHSPIINYTTPPLNSLLLQTNNTYTGGTMITSGTVFLGLGGNNTVGSESLGTGTVTVGANGRLAIAFSNATFANALSNNGLVNVYGTSIELRDTWTNKNGANLLLDSGILLNGTASAGNSFTNESGGTITLQNAGGLNHIKGAMSNSGTIVITSGNLRNEDQFTNTIGGIINNNSSITNTPTGTFTNTGTITTGISSNFLNFGRLLLTANSTFNGPGRLQMAGGILEFSGSGITFTTPIQLNTDSIIRVGASVTQNISQIISSLGSTGFIKDGTGTLILSNALNTYTGSTTINAGTLQTNTVGALPGTTDVFLADVSGAILNLNNFNQSIASLAGGGTTGGNVALGSAILTTTGNASLTYGGVISGTLGAFVKQGTGTLTLSGIHTYTGGTNILGGILALSGAGSLANTSAVTANGTFDISSITPSSSTIGALNGNGAVALGAKNLTFGNGTSSTFSGVISGSGALTKAGTGIQTLTAIQTYTGTTNIQAGTLALTSTASIASSAGVQLSTGGVFDTTAGNQTIKNLSGTGGLVNLGNANLLFGTSSSTTYQGTFQGLSPLIKQGTGVVTLTTASPLYGGQPMINAGGITLQHTRALGTGLITIANNAALTLDFSNTVFSNTLSGNGTTFVAGQNINLNSNNSAFAGSWNISGSASVTSELNLGTASVFLNGTSSQLALDPSLAAAYTFNRNLTGTGTLIATMNTANNAFALGATVGNAFTGTVTLGRGTFDLSGLNTTALTNATLNLTQDNVTTVGGDATDPQIQTIGNFSLNGGKLIFDGPTPTTPISPDKITTHILTLNSGAIQVTIPNTEDPPEHWVAPTDNDPLLMQDDIEISPLINATSLIGHGSQVQLLNQDGSVITPSTINTINITEGAATVAMGSFGYALLGTSTGLSVTYGLTQLALQPGQTTVLAGDHAGAGANDFHAQMTGAGNLEVDATTSVRVGNINNNYTGTTTIKGALTVLETNNALGNTSNLMIDAGAITNMNGKTQTVGTLTAAGAVDMANGTLTVTHGGTTAPNMLKGAGNFNLSGGLLNVAGANPTFTATTDIGAGAEIVITNTSGLGTGTVTDNGMLTISQAAGTFTNPMAGTGSLHIKDNANVTLVNARTHQGGTTVSGSTVTTATDAALGSTASPLNLNNATFKFDAAFNIAPTRPITLANDVVVDTAAFSTTLNQSITGSGSLTKTGTGRLSITGNSPYNGAIIVGTGEMKINASITNAAVTINKGAILSGNSTLGSVINNGIISPGNSIGTKHIVGAFINNGTYRCEVNDVGQSNLITVDGVATLNGQLLVIPEVGNYQNGQTYTYTILTSTNLINTTFASVTGTSPLFGYSVVYQPNAVLLKMIKNSTFSSTIPQGNAGIVARNLDSLQTTSGTLQTAIETLNTLPVSQLVSALNQLDAAENASIQRTLAGNFFDLASTLANTLHDPLERSVPQQTLFTNLISSIKALKSTLTQLFTPISKRTKVDERLDILPVHAQLPQAFRTQMGQTSVWINTSTRTITQKAQGSPGTLIPEIGTTTNATQVGIDYQVNQQLLVGVTTGYTHSSYRLSDNYGRGKVNSYQLGIYGSYHVMPEWYVDGVLSYGHNRLKGNRNISFANFKATASQAHQANQVGAIVESGYEIALPCNLIATPMASLGLVYLDEAGYTEKDAGTVGLTVKARGRTHLQTKIGGQLAKYLVEGDTQLYGFVKLAYTYRKGLGSANAVTSSFIGQPSSFTVFAKAQPQNMASPGAGFTALFKNDVYVTIAYNGDFGKYQRAHEGLIKIGKKF